MKLTKEWPTGNWLFLKFLFGWKWKQQNMNYLDKQENTLSNEGRVCIDTLASGMVALSWSWIHLFILVVVFFCSFHSLSIFFHITASVSLTNIGEKNLSVFSSSLIKFIKCWINFLCPSIGNITLKRTVKFLSLQRLHFPGEGKVVITAKKAP